MFPIKCLLPAIKILFILFHHSIPLPVEILGGWHKKAVEQLRKLARAQARSSGKEDDDAIRHLFQRLGVLLVKGNAALILNRIPSFSLPDIDGEL